MLEESSEFRDVHGITDEEKELVKAFMQGAVYSWVKNCSGVPFTVRDLVGGENYNWEGTPLQALYTKHVDCGKEHESAVEAAARDLGWLTKTVLHDDRRHFEVTKVGGKLGKVSSYRWTGDGDD